MDLLQRMHTVSRLWAVEFLHRTASLPGGSGQRRSCSALPHCLGAVGSATPAMHGPTTMGHWESGTPAFHCRTAWAKRAMGVLQCTAPLLVLCCVWLSCLVLCCIVLCCVMLCCVVLCCVVPKALLPEGNGRDVYPRVQVNGLGCVCCVRAVCKCVVA